jgi:dihydrofolate reductase
MGVVISSASVSLDGFIARDDNSVGALFDWYGNGEVEVPHAGAFPPFRMTAESARYWSESTSGVGALVVGRTLFDFTNGWNGRHPLNVPVVVVTHTPPTDWPFTATAPFHFVTEGVEAAVDLAGDLAEGRDVNVAAGTIAGQALIAGLLDEIAIDLVPILFGQGRRYFEGIAGPVSLGDPTIHVPGRRVTHLRFPVAS